MQSLHTISMSNGTPSRFLTDQKDRVVVYFNTPDLPHQPLQPHIWTGTVDVKIAMVLICLTRLWQLHALRPFPGHTRHRLVTYGS